MVWIKRINRIKTVVILNILPILIILIQTKKRRRVRKLLFLISEIPKSAFYLRFRQKAVTQLKTCG